jgi:DNA-binding transcriptional MocR family regulator
MQALRLKLARARRDTAVKLRKLGIHPWAMPRGGFNLWCQLPDGLDSTAVTKRAMAEDVVLAPGNVFSVSQNADRFMRFNVAQCGEPRFWDVLQRALAQAD